MITSNLVGGLGNYMFQIATSFSLSIDNNDDLVYDINDNIRIHTHLNNYLENIFSKIKFTDKKILTTETYDEPYFHYKKIDYKPNLRLNGYYQSEKYFFHNRKKIIDLFEINSETESYLQDKYGELLKENSCSLHVRRGDYLNLPNHHPVCSVDYYLKSFKEIGEDRFYFIFSDDINWCRENLNFIKNKIFVEGNKDYQDLYLMSKCNDNIIANSSFSWWGAWLNKTHNKKVICPSIWFGPSYHTDTLKDLFPETWKVI